MRPEVILISGRNSRTFGPTPRTITFTCDPSSFLNRLMSASDSAERIGLPSVPCLTPTPSAISRNESRLTELAFSDEEPLRMMITRSSRPAFSIVLIMPVDMASTDVSTATTPAMPITMTNEVAARCGKLRRFIAVTAPI
jgi:hypothetical protein